MTTLRREPALLLALVLAGSSGCSGGKGVAAGPSERDSAGVRIVESASPVWGEVVPWRIGPEPLLDLGSADGEEPYLFDYVETALRQADGTIVVANAGSGELRFFDSTGRFVRSAGRRGGGPGEFDGGSSVHIWLTAGGSIVANDAGNRRVHVFDSAGALRGSILLTPPPEQSRPSIQDVFPNGDWLVETWLPRAAPRDGIQQAPQQLHRYSPDGAPALPLVATSGRTLLTMTLGPGRIGMWVVPFAADPFALVLGEDVLVAPDGANRVDRYRPDGRLIASYRWEAPRRLAADVWDTYRRDDLAEADSAARPRIRQVHEQARPSLPERIPGPIRAIVDGAGNTWLQRYYLTSETARLNDILAPDGRWLGTIALPEGSWLLQAGTDFVVLWVRDDLGVEHVRLHRLHRGS
ncbi:MAG: hypothetical protein AB7L66_11265 [Gemmatimonadales bacterium]